MVDVPGWCVVSIDPTPNFWTILVVKSHTIQPKPTKTRRPKRPRGTLMQPFIQVDRQMSFSFARATAIQFSHVREIGHACRVLFPSMSKCTLIEVDQFHSTWLEIFKEILCFIPSPKSSRLIPFTILGVSFGVLRGFQHKPSPIRNMFHVGPFWTIPRLMSMHVPVVPHKAVAEVSKIGNL